jgi:hypothetical protein
LSMRAVGKAKKEIRRVSAQPPPVAKNPELFFALIGPAGTDLKLVTDSLRKELGAVGYDLEVVKMSKLLEV